MRLIARGTLRDFWEKHPETKTSLQRWEAIVGEGAWTTAAITTAAEIQAAFRKAKVLNGKRVRFEVAGGDCRLIAAFKFKNQIAFVKFIGTHGECDRIDALTVSLY